MKDAGARMQSVPSAMGKALPLLRIQYSGYIVLECISRLQTPVYLSRRVAIMNEGGLRLRGLFASRQPDQNHKAKDGYSTYPLHQTSSALSPSLRILS